MQLTLRTTSSSYPARELLLRKFLKVFLYSECQHTNRECKLINVVVSLWYLVIGSFLSDEPWPNQLVGWWKLKKSRYVHNLEYVYHFSSQTFGLYSIFLPFNSSVFRSTFVLWDNCGVTFSASCTLSWNEMSRKFQCIRWWRNLWLRRWLSFKFLLSLPQNLYSF